MEATGFRKSVQLCRERHHVTDECCTPCPDRGGFRGPSKDQKVTAVVQKRNQDEAKSLQTTAPPEGKVRHSFVSLPVIDSVKLKTAKALAEKAVKMHRVFSVQGHYPVIREALRARGWVEQRTHRPNQHAQRGDSRASPTDAGDSDNDANDVRKYQDPDEVYDLMSRLVRNAMVYFYWTNRRDAIDTNSLRKEQITNHFTKAGSFTTKVGLCVNLSNLHWFDSADPDTFFPRCYRLGAQDEKQAFIEDYRRTVCTSLLKYIVEREQGVSEEGMSCNIWPVRDKSRRNKRQFRPMVLSQMIDSALKVCQEFLDIMEHNDIDMSLGTPQTLTNEEWEQFIDSYYFVVHGGAEVENSDHFVKCCKAMLQRLGEVRPQLDIDGIHNIWIIKPGAKSRGRGIKCVKRLDEILRLVKVNPTLIKESKWVVQKYLERPLLVHGTKFDMRQWFLVTDWNPLTVWFYKKCYLRFSTQPYSLDKLDSSVHLCNNSIQKHLRPSKQRHRGIPADNMWSDDQFRTFLSSQGREAQWQAVVVPGMKKAIIHALQTTQDLMESRKNTFELYGADFMLGRDLRPWLIEINASPTMAPSTRITARLCSAVQEDTLRVILDRRVDRTANTGDFQLIYRQAAVDVPQYKAMLQRLGEVRPQLDIDGIHNIWIIKPGAKSRGRGIKCVKRLDEILRLVKVNPTLIKESKWVVQKYLERPLLVHGTKFDMRQWFLVTDWNPLTVWFYKKCYLRFSTQPYSLDKLDSSVHLCNNSIQKHLRPSKQRHRGIPADNMWSDDQFRTFLSSQGREAQWQAVVVPGMKKAIIHALQTTQDLMESRKNTFELYGADFMLGRDLRPWLIEINASPTMAPSTRITARLCSAVQEDTLRVILDRRVDRTANTGDFQLIYRQAAVDVPQYVGLNLLVEGFKIQSSCPLPPLRPSNLSASKRHGPVKEKKPVEEKVKPLSKMPLSSTETQLRNTSSRVLPPPPLPPEPPVPIPTETVTLHLPMTVDKSIHLPMSDQSHSVFLCTRRPEVSNVCSDKVQPCTTEKHQGPSLPLEMTLSQSQQAATSTLSA
ncbi:tubulin monoglycylase TTLL3-like [Seriola lalandi dorsalis]|uniref:tubulin monoglycylase TTLL3-like n=1 Tax=Seriola lalandi dorsalis TaxID=1841481 RepID=UPI000C6F523F|nr:tubulin monoglycylase TTLL3-like [Seriola lalandi dorsalis]